MEVVEGMQFDRGYLSPYFVTDAESMELISKILMCKFMIKKSRQLKTASRTRKVSQAGRSMLIISEDIEGEALATLVVNKLRGTLKICAVKLQDSATGAKLGSKILPY